MDNARRPIWLTMWLTISIYHEIWLQNLMIIWTWNNLNFPPPSYFSLSLSLFQIQIVPLFLSSLWNCLSTVGPLTLHRISLSLCLSTAWEPPAWRSGPSAVGFHQQRSSFPVPVHLLGPAPFVAADIFSTRPSNWLGKLSLTCMF